MIEFPMFLAGIAFCSQGGVPRKRASKSSGGKLLETSISKFDPPFLCWQKYLHFFFSDYNKNEVVAGGRFVYCG